jgi:hypothetical protein
VRIARQAWWIAGLATGVAGLGTSYFAAELLSVRASPVLAVAELIIKLTPGAFAENAIQTLGHKDKPVLVTVVLIGLAVIFAWTGSLARRSWWASLGVLAVVTGIGAYAVSQQRNAGPADYAPVAVGFVTWLICLSILTDNLRAAVRRPGGEASSSAPGSWSWPRSGPACSVGWWAPGVVRSRRPAACCDCRASPSRWPRPAPPWGSRASPRG